jgi:hypothetical protein
MFQLSDIQQGLYLICEMINSWLHRTKTEGYFSYDSYCKYAFVVVWFDLWLPEYILCYKKFDDDSGISGADDI